MKVVFVGNVLPNDIFFKVSKISPSTNNVQLNYVRYLHEKCGDDLFVYSCNFNTRHLENEKHKKTIKPYLLQTEDGIKIRTISFDSRRALMNVSLVNSLKKELRSLRKDFKNERFVFVVNNHFYYHSLPVFLSKKKGDSVFTILNEAIDVRYLPSHKKATFKDCVVNLINLILLRRNDGLISFSRATIDDYKMDSKPHLNLIHASTMSGVDYGPKLRKSDGEFLLFYGGLINNIYGIGDILAAMKYLPSGFRLIICGGGDESMIETIKTAAREDERIKYLGLVKREEVLKLEAESDLLLMVRDLSTKQNRYIAKYSQPSKAVEYLQSGTPVLATNIDGLPRELREYICLIEGGISPKQLAETIISIKENYHACYRKALNGKEYVLKECSVSAQKDKFLGFIFGNGVI